MKKSLVVLLVVVALVVLVSPGIVGRLAEQSLEENLDWAERGSGEVQVTTESFDRGWFSSEGRHRVEIRQGPLYEVATELSARSGHSGVPSLVIDTRMDHGIVPFTSMSRDEGSLKPGLASTVSTLKLDPGDGELIELPGTIYSDIALSGETTSRYLAEPGSFQDGGSRAEWQGADITFVADPSTGSLTVDGAIQSMSFTDGRDSTELAGMHIESSQVLSDYGFSIGEVAVEVGPVSLASPGGAVSGFERLTMDASSDIEDERLSARSVIDLSGLAIPHYGDVRFVLDLVMSGLDAESVGRITRSIQEAQSAGDPDLAMQRLFPVIEDDLQTLLAAGAEIRLDQFDVSLPQGDVEASLTIDVPPSDAGARFSWAGVLLNLSATADVRLPAALVEMARATDPQAAAVIDMGFLVQDGDFYDMKAAYASGLLTVNGRPMPVPMPGM